MSDVEQHDWREVNASFYGLDPVKEHLKPNNADNSRFDPEEMSAASWDYPLGTQLDVYNPMTRITRTITVKDRGPNKRLLDTRQLDLTVGAYRALGCSTRKGIANLQIRPTRGVLK